MIKKFESYKQIYKLDDMATIQFKNQYINQLKDMYLPAPGGNVPLDFTILQGVPGKMKWEDDDFFSTVEFEKNGEKYKFIIPSYTLESEMSAKVRKYNL